ncbi:MAG: HDOD domain-containing protein [Thioalkalivibrionaceae bacterium]
MRALIVQADPIEAAMAETILQGVSAWPEILMGRCLQEARDWVSSRLSPDLILIDHHLGDGAALPWVAQMRASNRRSAVIIVADRSDRSQLVEARRANVGAWLQQPVDDARLRAAFEAALVSVDAGAGRGSDQIPGDAGIGSDGERGDGSVASIVNQRLLSALKNGVPIPDYRPAARMPSARAAVDAQALIEAWRDEPILHARLIDLANQRRYVRSVEPIGSLSGAVAELGVDVARRYVAVRQQRLEIEFDTDWVKDRAAKLYERAANMAACVAARLSAFDMVDESAHSAALLHQAGEFALLSVVQRALRDGVEVQPDVADGWLKSQWPARLGAAMKTRWRLPLCLKQRIGACYGYALESAGPELRVMRLAALDVSGESDGSEARRLERQIKTARASRRA